ncbi:hypothetical protein NC653_016516 [Populus alba x Populus x berolinensis]|uniref:Uncharacterized protein n=1 Tax=Populus alba x Populus x berolinensis TaxID=444605 RepID=A0AAD6VZT1_9ROSI|nr:hypothetical protein NC653_016516 [Populus alba x Populus x berolinensis]
MPAAVKNMLCELKLSDDTQLLLWDLEMDEIVVPLRRCPPGGSPTFSTGSQSSHWDSVIPVGTLQPAPSMRDVPKLSPVLAHRVHTEPLSGLVFRQESVLTGNPSTGSICIWRDKMPFMALRAREGENPLCILKLAHSNMP